MMFLPINFFAENFICIHLAFARSINPCYRYPCVSHSGQAEAEVVLSTDLRFEATQESEQANGDGGNVQTPAEGDPLHAYIYIYMYHAYIFIIFIYLKMDEVRPRNN